MKMGKQSKNTAQTVVVALGGNALEDSSSPTADNQKKVIEASMTHIAELISAGMKVVVTHGNGPQVGRIGLQNEAAKEITPPMPFDVCGAMSQGMLGYHIQQALKGELNRRSMAAEVSSLITQVVVNPHDEAFNNPTKPIGPFYTKSEAEALERSEGYVMKEDSGRGFRRVIASPKPLEIVELATIKALLDENITVIAVGGGGVPVVKKGTTLDGVEAVIDKDFASAKLAENIDAHTLVILTEVEKVALNFGKENQKWLNTLTLQEVEEYTAQGHFAKGSMLPKVEACAAFVQSKKGRKALITSLSKVNEALRGETGTHIVS